MILHEITIMFYVSTHKCNFMKNYYFFALQSIPCYFK